MHPVRAIIIIIAILISHTSSNARQRELNTVKRVYQSSYLSYLNNVALAILYISDYVLNNRVNMSVIC